MRNADISYLCTYLCPNWLPRTAWSFNAIMSGLGFEHTLRLPLEFENDRHTIPDLAHFFTKTFPTPPSCLTIMRSCLVHYVNLSCEDSLMEAVPAALCPASVHSTGTLLKTTTLCPLLDSDHQRTWFLSCALPILLLLNAVATCHMLPCIELTRSFDPAMPSQCAQIQVRFVSNPFCLAP